MSSLDMLTVWPTRSRTGSQFVVQLTAAFTGFQAPQSRINGARGEGYRGDEKAGDFKKLFQQGRGLEYLAENGIRSLKFEDPGKDDFILELARAAPQARFVASHRPIEAVIESHHNITSWGHAEADVLYQFSACLNLYEALAAERRMFLINVDQPDAFNAKAFAAFLGLDTVPARAQQLVDEWTPINDLRAQVERGGKTFEGRTRPDRIERLRSIHDWVDGYEARYAALWQH